MIKHRLQEDIKIALKSGQGDKANLLRFLLAQIQGREIEKRGKGESEDLVDEDVVVVLQREVKKRKEAIELFKKGGREDLVRKEEGELKDILVYLPTPMEEDEIARIVDELYKKGFSDFNTLMKESMKVLKGKVDGNAVAAIIKKRVG